MPAGTLEDLLEQCVREIHAGRATFDECLAWYPDQRASLEPLLRIAVHIRSLEHRIDPARRVRARVAFVEALHAERDRPARGWWPFVPLPALLSPGRLGVPLMIGAIAVITIAASGGAAYAAMDALPDGPLYGVKTAIEQAQFALAANDGARVLVQLDIVAHRLDEIEKATAVHNVDAAQAAAGGYANAVAAVSDQIATLKRNGQDTERLTERLTASLERQQETLQRVAENTSGREIVALNRAREQAVRGLARVRVKTGKDHWDDRTGAKGTDPAAINASGSVPAPAKAAVAITAMPSVATTPDSGMSVMPPVEPGALNENVGKADGDHNNMASGFLGLKSKLDAAAASLERGQPGTLLDQLHALHNQLEAMRRSGQVTESEFRTLEQTYDALVQQLKEREEGASSSNRPRGPTEKDDQRGNDDKGDRGTGATILPIAPATLIEPPKADGGSGNDRSRGQTDGDGDRRDNKGDNGQLRGPSKDDRDEKDGRDGGPGRNRDQHGD